MNMKNLMLVFLLACGLVSTLVSHQTFAKNHGQWDDQNCDQGTGFGGTFGCGSDEFDFERYSNENVLRMIERDMDFACNRRGLCTLHSTTSNDQRFTARVNFGEGNPFGNMTGGGGSVIVTDGGDGLFNNQQYWGVTLEYSRGRCTQTVNVPRSLYISMNRYMYDLIDENGQTRRGFDPAKEAMIMFYSTIMKEATGCVAPR
jgi:hypothetical protein